MARQRNESPATPQDRRKTVVTHRLEHDGGGKGAPVNQQTGQLSLPLRTAECPAKGAVGSADSTKRASAGCAVPKPRVKHAPSPSATMEEVAGRLNEAFQMVASNKGAPGPDKQSIEQVRKNLAVLLPDLAASLLDGSYLPGDIRRVWIPKPSGGQRALGIPNVMDRVVQQATRMVLEPLYEPSFHPSSHGFRPSRSCHTAIAEACEHINGGREWVVDLDLESFFDRVNHQRLLARLALRVKDQRLLTLIRSMLKAKAVLPNGVLVSSSEGVPQGGPLSPLLSNIVLDELDWELDRRGHRFVRYADDSNVYVRSERAGQRVMASLTRFIEGRLRLKVNQSKSAVARPEQRHFLGFSLRCEPMDGDVEVLLSKRSKDRISQRVVELTPRNWGASLRSCIHGINEYVRGWIGFFGICTAGMERVLRGLDAHIRRRLRAIQLKHWKRKRTMARCLIRLGVGRKTAWRRLYEGRKSLWALSHDSAVDRGLRNAYFAERGLVSLAECWRAQQEQVVAPVQLSLALG